MSDDIIDTNKPSAGRMYDYFLGGSHNFEVDRQAGDQVLAMIPFTSKFARLQRWALGDIAIELTERRGFDVIIDFASGLPTVEHIHSKVSKGTTVIYSDIDPVVVDYSREILNGAPDVYYFQSDANFPDQLLNHPEVQKILAGRRKVAFGFWGFTFLQKEEEIAHSMRTLYDWAAPGSCVAYNANSVTNKDNPDIQKTQEIYARLGAPLNVHTLEKHLECIQPWKIEKEGFISLLDWHGFDKAEVGVDAASMGEMGGGFGAYLTK